MTTRTRHDAAHPTPVPHLRIRPAAEDVLALYAQLTTEEQSRLTVKLKQSRGRPTADRLTEFVSVAIYYKRNAGMTWAKAVEAANLFMGEDHGVEEVKRRAREFRANGRIRIFEAVEDLGPNRVAMINVDTVDNAEYAA